MRSTGPFSTYNRYLALNWRKPDALPIDKSMLGTFAAAESLSIMAFVKFCKGDATTYAAKQEQNP
jgi:hypothetical protein